MKYIKKSATKQMQLVLSDLFQNMHILYVNYFIFKSFNCQQFAKAHNSSSLHFYTIGKIKNIFRVNSTLSNAQSGAQWEDPVSLKGCLATVPLMDLFVLFAINHRSCLTGICCSG